MASTRVSIEVDGRTLRLSNLDKPLYPSGFTKAEVIDYYRRVAPVLLPHLRDRPLTLRRYPEGSTGESFYEKHCPAHRPAWLRTTSIWSSRRSASTEYCVVDTEAALVWAANLAAIELHTPLARARRLDSPDLLAFDLDPGAPADILDCARVALRLRDVLAGWSLRSFVKTSGRKGLQVYVPLRPPASYDETKLFAHAVARLLAEEQPARITAVMRKDLRAGKVFIDWSQNDEHKTTVCAYSLRAAERPTVSTPLRWTELERALAAGRRELLVFEARDVLRRVARDGDLFAEVLARRQRLPPVARRTRSKSAVPSSLREYAARRHFDVTPEPAPRRPARARGALRFMIHKHHARRLHYDLRLEMGGVLASWAVPRGPSYDPADRRLAIQTEDHPLEYGDFEGRIPEGEYGAGDALVWDRGFWDTVPPGQGMEQKERGRMVIELHGEKLEGRWHLVRTRGAGAGPGTTATKAAWLLIKASDEDARAGADIIGERPESVVSGRIETSGPARRT